MINKDLALKLKAHGYPQPKARQNIIGAAHTPNATGLFTQLGEDFGGLVYRNKTYVAASSGETPVTASGSSVSVALANLYILINKENENTK